MVRPNTTLLQGMADFIVNRLNLPAGFTAADNKIVGKTTYLAGIQEQNVTSLLVASRFYCFAGNLYRFQPTCSPSGNIRLQKL
jgi:hypothetical protein